MLQEGEAPHLGNNPIQSQPLGVPAPYCYRRKGMGQRVAVGKVDQMGLVGHAHC